MLLAIQMMQFYLRTSYGDSDGHYGGNTDNPFQGCCQGNGGAPAAWVAVSTLLVMYLKAQGCEAKFVTAISCVLFSFAALIFVDDTDLPVIGSSSRTTPAQVGAKMQRSASVWAGGLRVTGGALKPEKCYWYLIAFEWYMGQWRYARKATHPFDIKVPNADGVLEIIKRLETDESKEAVGIIQNAEGDEEDMLTEMEEKASTWIRHIRNGHLPRHLAWQACKGTIMRSIAYPFPATTISTKQAFTAMQKFYRETIPTLGTNRNFPHELRYAPAKYNGLGLPNWKWEQEIAHVQELLTHGGSATLTGDFFRSQVEQVQVEIGTNIPLFSLPFKRYGTNVTPCWIKCLWEFVSEHGITLENDDLPTLTLQRRHDAFLMDVFRRFYHSPDSIMRLNRVRIHMQAMTLADVTTGDGTAIRQSAVNARPDGWEDETPRRPPTTGSRTPTQTTCAPTRRVH